MPIGKTLARLVFGVLLGASTVLGCESGTSLPLNSLDAGGADGGLVTCVQICGKADDCCVAAMPIRRDGGLPCNWAPSCSDTSSEDQLIAECQAFIALFPLNPSCQ